MPSKTQGTQHLTALAAPPELVDWRLALCLEIAHSAGILDSLPATAAQIAAERHLDARAVRAILSVLAAWEYVETDTAGVFSTGAQWPDAEQLAALIQHGAWIRRWSEAVPRRLRDRQAPIPEALAVPGWVSRLSLLESACQPFIEPVVEMCLAHTENQSPLRILDLGGGHGAYARQFARRGHQVVLQDLPEVIDAARADGGLAADQVELVVGNAFETLTPGPFDVVLCGTFTNMFSLDQVRRLLIGIRGVLAPSGRLVLATWLRDHGPVGAAFGVQMLIATAGGDAHSEADYRTLLEETGYSNVTCCDIGAAALSVICAIKDGE